VAVHWPHQRVPRQLKSLLALVKQAAKVVVRDWRKSSCYKMISYVQTESSMLHSPFERALIGFDLRKAESVAQLFLTSYDEDVRFEDLMETSGRFLSAINLFQTDPTDIPSIKLPPNARVVAFDLPIEYLIHQARGNVSTCPRINMEVLRDGWKFIGFDIVDPMTQSSAFSLVAISPRDLTNGIFNGLSRNGYGVVDDQDAALKAASFFDSLIPEHAPFVPCGIWLKK
jgi:hypothetical protein